MGCTESSAYAVGGPPTLPLPSQDLSSLKLPNQGNSILVNDQKKKHNLSEAEIIDMYERSKGSLEKFFHLLSERVTEFYDDLSSEILELLNGHKITHNETKVLISEQVLLMALDVLEVVGKQINFSYSVETFHYFNKAQSNLLAYLKMKYPRAGNVFVSSDLSQKFKSFDFVENPKNDMLAKFKIFFTGSSEASIVKQVKIFFNAIIDELDDKFPVFKTMMEEHVFKYEEGEGEHKKSKILNYKIGRKIPENTSKFVVDDSEELTINSPEIFRTIVKWVQDLQDWFHSPEDQINSRDTFKIYKTTKTGNVNGVIAKDEIDELPSILKKKIREQIDPYKSHLNNLRKQMDIFNINLLKILYTTERKQKYVPLRQAKIIKYAMLNTKIVSWMLSEMLIYILQKLVEVGQSMEETKVRRKMDLIKFTVTDLMRAQVVGNKKQILRVYSNIQKLQKNNEINIIKIKNRLGTSLNDAMIIFTIKQSKLICELQLILSEGGSEIEKLKNIQFLNHMLYELERSPYGVLSEIAVILGYKDSKINFQSKIRFEKNSLANFEACKKNHKTQTEKVQKKPFLCIQCTQFYLPLENIFDYTYCQECCSFQCCKCAFSIDEKFQKEEISKRFVKQLESEIFTVKIKPKLPKQITISKVLQKIYPQKLFFKNIFPKKPYYEITPKELLNFIKEKKYVQATGKKELEDEQHLYFLLVQFRGAQTYLSLYYWNQSQQQIQNCFDPSQVFLDLKKISTSYYDFIAFFKTLQIERQQVATASKLIRLCLKPEQNVKNIKIYRYVTLSRKHNVVLILKVEVSKTSGNVDGLEVEEKLLLQKKDFVHDSLEDIRKSLPQILSVREHFQMKNIGITSAHLQYFKTCSQKSIIKFMNLSDNKIANISTVLQNCQNIEQLIIAKNFIKQLKIKKKLPNLVKLIAYGNFITVTEGLELAPDLQNLNLEHNKLKNMKSLALRELRELNISNNKINSFIWIEKSDLPKLEILSLCNSGISYHGVDAKLDFQFDFPLLEELNFSENMANKLTIKADKLTFLDCSKCSLKNLAITSRKIQVLKLQKNEIENLQSILQNRMSELKQILCNDAGTVQKLPELDDVEVIRLDVSNCGLTDVSNLAKSSLIKIEELILDGNQNVKSLPPLKFLNLKRLSIIDVHLNDLSFVENSTLPLLEELEVTGEAVTENYLLECPTFKLPKIKKLKLKSLSFSEMKKFSLSEFTELQELSFQQLNSKNFPVLILPTLRTLSFTGCKVQNIEGLHSSEFANLQKLNVENFNQNPDDQNQKDGLIFKQERKLLKIKCQKLTKLQVKCSPGVNLQSLFRFKPNLEYFNATDNKLKIFPIMQLKNVKNLDFSDCQVENIANLTFCKLDCLEKLNFANNLITVVPELNMKSLKNLTFKNNRIGNVKDFEKSSLPMLQFIDFDKNELKQFPVLKFQKLKEMQIGNNPIQSLLGLEQCRLSSLEKLLLKDCKQLVNRTLPVINLEKCTSIKIVECNIDNVDNLEKSDLPQLTYLQLKNIPLKKLPILKMPLIKTFQIQVQRHPKNGSPQSGPHNFLQDISNMALWQCPKLHNIYIQNATAKKLPRLNLRRLQTLDLEGSDIQDIEQFKSSILPNLAEINLSFNGALNTMAFPNSVDHVIFNGCAFEVLDCENLEDSPCKIIELSKNRLRQIRQINTSQLEFLNLQDNQLTDIGSIFKESPLKLKNLSLKSNKIKSIPQFTFPQLNYLHISNNEIETLRIKKKNFPSLIGLYAQNNQITSVSTLDIPSLTSINLNKNQLQEINFFNEQYVETSQMKIATLRVENNKIKNIVYLPNVSNIYLKGNLLLNMDWLAACQTDFIAILSVAENRIASIKGFEVGRDDSKARFNVLSEVDLSANCLKDFQLKNVRFPSLDNLNLSKNQIQKFPQLSQSGFPNLLNLNLSDNTIRSLPTIYKFNKLRSLNLSNNKLSSLATKQLVFKDLRQLSLQGNLIKQLNGIECIKSHKLEKLNLCSNLLTRMGKLANFVALKEVNVDKNQIGDFAEFLASNINDWANLKFVYLINQDLKDKLKEEIGKKIHQKMAKSQCRNIELIMQTKSKLSKVSAKKQEHKMQQTTNSK